MLPRGSALLAVGVLLTAGSCFLVAADGSSTIAAGAELTIYKQVNEVHVSFTVEDGHKRLIRDVSPREISILDNGRPVSSLTSFRENSNLPLRLAVLMDCSDSMSKVFARERAAAQVFVERMLRPEIDSVLLVDFAGQSTIFDVPADSASLIATKLNSFEAAGHTAVYDAIYEASIRVQMTSIEHQPVRRVMILLSDGEDNDSRHGRSEAIEMAQRAEAVIYAITAHSRRYEYQGDAILHWMAEATGGRAFVLSSFDQVDRVFAEIERDLRTQYSLTFRPSAPTQCGFHPLQVQYRNRKMRVRAREGYYLCGASDSVSSR
jgi:Ca-activated chloride channel homolog